MRFLVYCTIPAVFVAVLLADSIGWFRAICGGICVFWVALALVGAVAYDLSKDEGNHWTHDKRDR